MMRGEGRLNKEWRNLRRDDGQKKPPRSLGSGCVEKEHYCSCLISALNSAMLVMRAWDGTGIITPDPAPEVPVLVLPNQAFQAGLPERRRERPKACP